MQVYNGSQGLVGQDCTGAAGVYTVSGLADGGYRVKAANFVGAAPTQWLGRSGTFAGASVVTIAGGAPVTAAAALLEPYSLVGRVVDGYGNPRSGVSVIVWNVAGGQAGTFYKYETLTTGADGTFVTRNDDPYPQLWFTGVDGVADIFSDSAFNFNSYFSPTMMPDTVMAAPEGTITGTLTPPGNFVSTNVCVFAYQAIPYGYPLGHACGPRGSAFKIGNLQTGNYGLRFIDSGDPGDLSTAQADFWGGGTAPYTGWFSYHTGNRSFAVTAGHATPVVVAWGGTITATVSSPGGTLAGGCMDVYSDYEGPPVATDCRDDDRPFSVPLSSDGYYRVKFRGVYGAFDGWYGGESTQSLATIVNVSDSQSVSLAGTLAPWAQIAGTITLPAGVDSGNGCMLATEVGGAGFFDSTCTDPATGLYALSVPPGDYHLKFFTSTTDAGSEWYDNAASMNDARTVTVAGATVTVNAQLALAGQISGDLTVAGGAPAAGACVHLYELDGDQVASACADGSGHYALESLPAGDYKLHVVGYGAWAGQWYGGSAVMSGASIITVQPGDVLTANTMLIHPGTIAGIVTAPGGQPALGGCIEAYTEDGGVYGESCVDGSGRYSLDVPAGNYELLFTHFHDSSNRALASQWFGGGRSYVAATTVAVVQGRVVNANAGLGLGGTLTGTSTVADTGAVALNGCVAARDTDTRALIDFSCVDGSGAYDMHLAPGSYLLQFRGFDTPAGTPLLTTWYEAVPVASMATVVVVAVGSTTTVASSQVLSAGSVYGKVVLPPGAAMDGTVEAYDATTGAFIASVAPGSDGAFRLEGLPNGRALRVLFANFTGAANTWLFSATTFNSASSIWADAVWGSNWTVTLPVPGVVVGIFPNLPNFLGTNVCVTAWYENGDFAAETCGAVGEAFSFSHLPAGGYDFEFTDDYGNYAEYSTSGDWSTAVTWISVAAGSTVDIAPPTVTLSGPSSLALGATAHFTVAVSPSVSGTAGLQYQVPGGSWVTSSMTIPVVTGVASFDVVPTGMVSYRVAFGGGTSNAVTVGAPRQFSTVGVCGSGPCWKDADLTPTPVRTGSVVMSSRAPVSAALPSSSPGTSVSPSRECVTGCASVTLGTATVPGVTIADAAKMGELNRRNRQPGQNVAILRQAAACFAKNTSSSRFTRWSLTLLLMGSRHGDVPGVGILQKSVLMGEIQTCHGG